MKKKIYVWFGILLISIILVGCEDAETALVDSTIQTSSEQTKQNSQKEKKQKSKKKNKKKKAIGKKNKEKVNGKNKIYYNPLDENIQTIREECISAFRDAYDVDRGRAFDSFFSSSKWISGEDDDGSACVEFVGALPKEKDNEYNELQVESGMKIHMIYEETRLAFLNCGFSLQRTYVCDKNDKFVYELAWGTDLFLKKLLFHIIQ